MLEQESQFHLPEEQLEKLRKSHEKEMREVEEEGEMPLEEISEFVTEHLEEKKEPLEPSEESLLVLRDEGKYLSSRQQRLIEISAFLQEKSVERINRLIRDDITSGVDPEPWFSHEDREEIEKTLHELAEVYEDLLDRTVEYPAARKMIEEIREYLDSLEGSEKYTISKSSVWDYVNARVDAFEQPLLLGESHTPEQKQRVMQVWSVVKYSVVSRLFDTMKLVQRGTMSETETEGFKKIKITPGRGRKPEESERRVKDALQRMEKASPEEQQRIWSEADADFDAWLEYVEQHSHTDTFPVGFNEEEERGMTSQLARFIQEKGKEKKGSNDRGKHIVIQGPKAEDLFGAATVDVWAPGNGLIHVIATGIKRDGEPTYLKLSLRDGHIDSSVTYYDDNPESIAYAEQVKRIPHEKWQSFVTHVIEEAERYTPEEDSEDETSS